MSVTNKKFGFTLAEALMALLIVSLITIASVPIITKKKRLVETSPHGKWKCTLNANGDHIVYGSEANPAGWVVSGDKCQFLVPRGARAFTVSAIGGGGGGAGSSIETIEYENSFAVEKYGTYRFFAIGGGGQGGGWNCNGKGKKYGHNGANGGAGTGEIDIDSNTDFITINVGSGGSGGSGACGMYGVNGNETTIYKSKGTKEPELIVKATGGGGGAGRLCQSCKEDHNSCEHNDAGPSAGTVEFGSSVVSKNAKADLSSIRSMFDNTSLITSTTGKGGSTVGCDWRERCQGHDGGNGAAMMVVDIAYVGKGGSASPSPVIERFFPSFNTRRFDVTIGAGGKGGAISQNGFNGGDTKVGTLFTVYGGTGGTAYNPYPSERTSDGKYLGGNGELGELYLKGESRIKALGGYTSGNNSANGQNATFYGSGGGGAGLKGSTNGKGGDGAPGYVLIEW